MNYNTSEIDHLIRNRRSIKPEKYTGERVQDEIIKKMLENASWAPNHGKTEPWKFVVFTNNGLQEFAEFQATTYKNITSPCLLYTSPSPRDRTRSRMPSSA